MNTAQITFNFTIGHYNGTMGMTILSDDIEVISQDVFSDTSFSCTLDVKWPSKLTINVFNKGPNDTLVGENDKILQDKFIKIDDFVVDKMKIPDYLLFDIIVLDTGTNQVKGPYLGFNGTVNINFDKEDSFIWHLDKRKTLPPVSASYVGNEFERLNGLT